MISGYSIHGAGGTLAGKVYSDVIFSRSFVSHTAVSYDQVGSGKGVNLSENNKVDFCGSDKTLSEATDYSNYPDLQMYPTVAAAVAIYHNLDAFRGTEKNLVLARETVAKIFLGETVFWDDPSITSVNPNVSLPHHRIHVYVRADDSGTTSIFTEGLSKFYTKFSRSLGHFSSPNGWCQGAARVNISTQNQGGISFNCQSCTPHNTSHQLFLCFLSASQMVDMVAIDPFGLSYSVYDPGNAGYVQMASMVNKAGMVVQPSTLTASYSTMEKGGSFSSRMTADLLDSGSSFGWPLVSYTYLVMRTNTQISSCNVRKAVVEFWVWFYKSPGARSMISNIGFVPLPSFIADYVVQQLENDIMCVDDQGNFYLAAESLLHTRTENYLISNSVQLGFSLVNNIYSSFVDTQFTWDPQISSSSSIYSLFSLRLTPSIFFSIYSPDVVHPALQKPLEDAASFPYLLHAVVPVFTISGVSHNLNLTAQVLANIFLCEVTAWDDPSILRLNPGLLHSGSATGKNITTMYLLYEDDTTALLNRFLSRFSPSYQRATGMYAESLPVCLNSIGVESESLMNAVVSYTDGALGYLSLKLAQASQLTAVSIVYNDQNSTWDSISASIKSVENCLLGSVPIEATNSTSTELTQFLSLPLQEFGKWHCWPISGVQNIVVSLQFQQNGTPTTPSCSDGSSVGNYISWLLDVKNVQDIFSSNLFVATSADGWKSSRALLQHNMMCDEELLLITIPACTLFNYEYTIGQCQGNVQARKVVYSPVKNWTDCRGGQRLPSPGLVECDHLIPSSFYGLTVACLCGLGILVGMLILLFQFYHFKKFLKEGHARMVLNITMFLAAILSCGFVLAINIGTISDQTCKLRPWFWNFPLDLIFAILYAKIRIGFAIFTSKKIKRMKTTWHDLLRWVCEVMAGEIVILTLWSVLGEPHAVSTFQTATIDGSSFIQVPMVLCSSKYNEIFSITLLVYKLCWYLVGSFMALKITVGATMAFQIWNMKSQQGETRFVGLATLNYVCFSCGMVWFVDFWPNPVQLILGQSLLVLWISTTTAMLSIWPVLKKVEMRTLFRPASSFSFSSKFSSISFRSSFRSLSGRNGSGSRHKNTAREGGDRLESSMTLETRPGRASSFQEKEKSLSRWNKRGSVGAGFKVAVQLEPLQELPERPSNTDFQQSQDPIVDLSCCSAISQEMKDFLECENDEGSVVTGQWVIKQTSLLEPLENTSLQYHRINFNKTYQLEQNSDTLESMHHASFLATPLEI